MLPLAAGIYSQSVSAPTQSELSRDGPAFQPRSRRVSRELPRQYIRCEYAPTGSVRLSPWLPLT